MKFVASAETIEEAKEKLLQYNAALKDASLSTNDAGKGVTALTYTFKAQDGIVKTLKFQYDAATQSIRELGRQEKQVTSIGERFSSMLKERGMSLVAYLGTFASFYRLVGVMRDGINVIHEVDTAFTELRKVAQESDDQLKSFANTMAFDIAGSVGSSGKDIINLTADFERLGYALSEAQDLAKNTAIYMNVGDMESSDGAMQHLVATIKGFNLDATDSMKIIDEFNEIGNNFAITSEDIGIALEKSAATLNQAGNSLEQSIALITSGQAVIQNAETMGAALRTISLRIRGRFLCPSMVKTIVRVA